MLKFIKSTISAMGMKESEDAYALNNQTWKNAMDLFESKNYIESINQVFKYINPQFEQVLKEGGTYEIKEGSSVIKIEIKDKMLNFRVNFLKHDGNPSIALLRKLAKMNMDVFTLSVARLSGNEVYVEYSDRIELSHPNKIYNVLDEMLYYTDLYDDLFVKKYGVSLYNDNNTEEAKRDNIDELWGEFQANIKETQSNLALYKKKKYDGYALDPYFNFYNKTLFCLNPEGIIKSVLNEMKTTIAAHMDNNARIKKVEKQFKILTDLTKADFEDSMYESLRFFVLNGRKFIDSQGLQNSLGAANFTRTHQDRHFILNSVYGEATIYNLLNRFIISKAIKKDFLKAVEKAHGKSDEVRSQIFCDVLNNVHKDLLKVNHLKAAA